MTHWYYSMNPNNRPSFYCVDTGERIHPCPHVECVSNQEGSIQLDIDTGNNHRCRFCYKYP